MKIELNKRESNQNKKNTLKTKIDIYIYSVLIYVMSVCNVCVCSGTLLMMMPKILQQKSNANKQAKQQKTKQKKTLKGRMCFIVANNKRTTTYSRLIFFLSLFFLSLSLYISIFMFDIIVIFLSL